MLKQKIKVSLLFLSMVTSLVFQSVASAQTIYQVKAGDNFYRIATMHHITVQQLLEANNMDGTTLPVETTLVIPESNVETVNQSSTSLEETIAFKTNEEALAYAKAHFDWQKYHQWHVDYEEGQFVVHFDLKKVTPPVEGLKPTSSKPMQESALEFKTLDEAVEYAKSHFDWDKHTQWYVDWKDGHYEVRYDMK